MYAASQVVGSLVLGFLLANRLVGVRSHWLQLLLVLVPCGTAASALLAVVFEFSISKACRPRRLNRLDFSRGVADDCRTLIVVPTLLSTERHLLRTIEIFEENVRESEDRNVRFCLLTDLPDSATSPGNAETGLLPTVVHVLRRLERRHRCNVIWLHRASEWNAREGVWMGFERKRGKLMDLNRYILGRARVIFEHQYGDVDWLAGVKYVITLDDDTRLSAPAAQELVACIAHPENAPIYDPEYRRVVAGYAVLQPRPRPLPLDGNASWYERICVTADSSPDVSSPRFNLYQDLFGEGSFYGKGIYDVRAFTEAVENEIPTDSILSHDLIEGCFARSGIVSDIAISEPSCRDYRSEFRRRHRWIRGDWQSLPWALRSRVTRAQGDRSQNRFSALSRWKIIDNVRRSVIPVAIVGICAIAWSLTPQKWWPTAAALCLVMVEDALWTADCIVRRPDTGGGHLAFAAKETARCALRLILKVVFLLHDSYVAASAAATALWRMCITRKKLLAWTPFHHSTESIDFGLRSWIKDMQGSLAVACSAVAALIAFRSPAMPHAIPLLLLWILAPAVGAVTSGQHQRRTASDAPTSGFGERANDL